MLGISYETWQQTCSMYFSLGTGTHKSYLQWFPFSKVTADEKEMIKSEDYFNKYIKNGAFMLFADAMHTSENYIQKSDGSFRNASLVSPLLYLVLQAVGMEISKVYVDNRPWNISTYYAGNYPLLRAKYKQDYDEFFKEVNFHIDEYQYFIKTDISNFFSNINVDKLIAQVDDVCNSDRIVFSQSQLQLYKELLRLCGNGRFPLIENSVASSYLATVVYLNKIDIKLDCFLQQYVEDIDEYKIVRYVDDLYILISSKKSLTALREAYNEIRNEYSSILKEYDLTLNTKKCCIKNSSEINEELKKSLYNEAFNGEKHQIEEQFTDSLLEFIQELSIELIFDSIDIETYNLIIEKNFSKEDIEFTANEVFNYFVYENESALQNPKISEEIAELIEWSISVISLDPKRLTVMALKTQNARAIDGILNQLHRRAESGKWNSYDTSVAIAYLIQTGFDNMDLLYVLESQAPDMHQYYLKYCGQSFANSCKFEETQKIIELIGADKKAYYLYFMYIIEQQKNNSMAAFAYYKNFFDRVTADFAFVYARETGEKKPNYAKYYKEGSFVRFYSCIEGIESIIEKAHSLRNSNPLCHSSSSMIDNNNSAEEIESCIDSLRSVIYEYIALND